MVNINSKIIGCINLPHKEWHRCTIQHVSNGQILLASYFNSICWCFHISTVLLYSFGIFQVLIFLFDIFRAMNKILIFNILRRISFLIRNIRILYFKFRIFLFIFIKFKCHFNTFLNTATSFGVNWWKCTSNWCRRARLPSNRYW